MPTRHTSIPVTQSLFSNEFDEFDEYTAKQMYASYYYTVLFLYDNRSRLRAAKVSVAPRFEILTTSASLLQILLSRHPCHRKVVSPMIAHN